MKTFLTALALAVLASSTASAGRIERACMRSDRDAANRTLCGCIQTVANRTLNSHDRQLVVKIFRDPHLAQEIRQSDRRSYERFWKKYKKFGYSAQTHCG